ncbi:UDP-N-acetylglucosamine--N-acetylmuramyl- (pentapeptide) pyrophosphoryl-undecaprenol N-acetylglucosamine transferase [Beutenbergia cavernae DSM 12333]|uniref:UDP-N-acetylglucosamine--N-acetylmuramyl-(pentapeptide) pyrophosphoryl-undecaprenol N-acetylglucosamine transferase n=1 Tax=Beutenbergia cavernae (strain ATCC BAA-8 / DSM 12333 / CCUG 43141 / JCM 11478 / NBRC 16432 / NCIMB 13614 / HKI 0122) TaxID=471853 RepID=C5BW59_BEUC1|nr:UDP-N-acetylglucosamine--N-acetylmuramyl- (pentapeptide) pyrophosphoryl-undecaprenol N-acetylglucosamine transferase [Beutenbergia cavernae DSM 12333]
MLAGGGTAGHVNPLLALADELRARDAETRVAVLGTSSGLEARLVPDRGYELVTIERVPFPRRPDADLVRFPGRYRRAVREAGAAIAAIEADVVVGFGGYVATPAYSAARRAHVPAVVHEQNARPGLANRLGARHAAAVAVTFPGTPLHARRGSTTVTGLPLRPEVASLVAARGQVDAALAARRAGAQELGLDPARTTVLVTGGSLGAQAVNATIAAAAPVLVAAGAQVLHLTGTGKADAVQAALDAHAPEVRSAYHVRPYLAEMERAYACADLVVARAGAGTVSEVAALGIGAVYVPLPVGNGEQRLNAAPIVDGGGGLLVADADFTPDWVADRVVPLLIDSSALTAMGAAARAAGVPDGAARLADVVTAVALAGRSR